MPRESGSASDADLVVAECDPSPGRVIEPRSRSGFPLPTTYAGLCLSRSWWRAMYSASRACASICRAPPLAISP